MKRPEYLFANTITGTGGGTNVLKVTPVESVTAIQRGPAVQTRPNSTLVVHISGTATVKVIENPFDGTPSAKDVTLATLSATTVTKLSSATVVLLDVTAISGTVSARLVNDCDD